MRLAAVDALRPARRVCSASTTSIGRVVGVQRRQGARRRGRRRRGAGRRRRTWWVWGWWSWRGLSRRPVIGSSMRASKPGVVLRHVARAAPRRVAGRRRRRPLVTPPASRRAWALLAWLALHPGEHARGAVAARFWPDVLDSSARASLRSALWELRRALGDDDALVAGRDRIALRCETDLAAFDAHVAAGRLEEAVALHRGPLLADLDDDWVLEARDEHAERLGSALRAARRGRADARRRGRLGAPPARARPARRGRRARPDAPAGRRPATAPRALAAYDRLVRPPARARSASRRRPQTRDAGRARCARTARPPPRGGARAGDGPRRSIGPRRASSAALAGAVGARSQAGARRRRRARRRGRDRQDAAGASSCSRAPAPTARAPRRCTAADLGGAPPFAPWVELLAGLARELDAAARRGRVAGGARRGSRRRCRGGSGAPRGAPRRRAARARPRPAVRGRGRARRARHRRPAARAAVRRRPPRRRADARARRLPRAPDRARCRCCSCSRAA